MCSKQLFYEAVVTVIYCSSNIAEKKPTSFKSKLAFDANP